MSLRVEAPGLLTTLQDAGREGCRHLGVGRAGALDAWSHAVANLLVGNPSTAPALEVTIAGPRLRFDHAARIAICGAEIEARVDADPVPSWRPLAVPRGATLSLGACRRGARAYLAVAGGFRVAQVLGSASTDLRGGFGGIGGRALATGDVLHVDEGEHTEALRIARWWIDAEPDVAFDAPVVVRVLAGRDALSPPAALFAHEWHVAAASDRQGLRLDGPGLQAADVRERISEPVAPGTIQLPPDGHPIVLLADAQTHGGYPRIGHAIRADWPRLAQLRPGDALRFSPCSREDALHAWRARCQRLARVELAIRGRLAAGDVWRASVARHSASA
ncbi:MAG: biotin-dependent carboxyltransferase family protein [Luteimonas sp.]